MQLKKAKTRIECELLDLLNAGYSILDTIQAEFINKTRQGTFTLEDDQKQCALVDQWTAFAIGFINSVFPSSFELKTFSRLLNPDVAALSSISAHHALRSLLQHRINMLDQVVRSNLNRYDDLRVLRIYIDDIDNFSKIRKVKPEDVSELLVNGYLDQPEDFIQISLEEILDVPFHKKDWGGEINDLYTSNILLDGNRVAAAFLLKGNGLRKKVLEIKECGKNGDQIVRLLDSPAQLFVIQFVGSISDYVVKDIEGKVNENQLQGKIAQYCIIDGVDTARLLRAYGRL
ncbi:hypothetical protein [Pantanalinema sp. GBBB05]|uniref:hypothetical protein n=1 Tax=Pantanalinema sp. GBBB05 TaxID=2604139 RepID=UPI001DF5CB58|nr:hypothetical protein [Pantanalinema sp. GBBB05]